MAAARPGSGVMLGCGEPWMLVHGGAAAQEFQGSSFWRTETMVQLKAEKRPP